MAQRINKQIGPLSAIESETHFFAVGLEMLRADFMPRSNNAALQERERRFDGVRVRISVCVNPETVANRLVLCFDSHAPCHAAIEVVIVSEQDFQVLADIVADELFERSARYIFRMEESQIAAALPDADYGFFLGSAPAYSRSVPTTADVGFIHFNLAVQHGLTGFHHGGTDAMAEIPCGLVAHAERALNLTGRHSLLCFTEQERGKEPLCQRQVGVIENRAGGDGKLVVAILAVEELLFGVEFDSGHLAARALRASGPAQPRQQLAALLVCREQGVYVN